MRSFKEEETEREPDKTTVLTQCAVRGGGGGGGMKSAMEEQREHAVSSFSLLPSGIEGQTLPVSFRICFHATPPTSYRLYRGLKEKSDNGRSYSNSSAQPMAPDGFSTMNSSTGVVLQGEGKELGRGAGGETCSTAFRGS